MTKQPAAPLDLCFLMFCFGWSDKTSVKYWTLKCHEKKNIRLEKALKERNSKRASSDTKTEGPGSPEGHTPWPRPLEEAFFLLVHDDGVAGGGGELDNGRSAAGRRGWDRRRGVSCEAGAGIEGSGNDTSNLEKKEPSFDLWILINEVWPHWAEICHLGYFLMAKTRGGGVTDLYYIGQW